MRYDTRSQSISNFTIKGIVYLIYSIDVDNFDALRRTEYSISYDSVVYAACFNKGKIPNPMPAGEES